MKFMLLVGFVFNLIFGNTPIYANTFDLELTHEDVVTDINEMNDSSSECVNDYKKLRNRTAIATGLGPVVGIVGLATGAYIGLSWEYGGQQALSPVLGPVLKAAAHTTVNFIIPVVVIGGTLTYQAVSISRLVKASKAYRLVKGLNNREPSKPLLQLVKRVQRARPDLNTETIEEVLMQNFEEGAFCDGSLVSKKRRFQGKLSKRLANLKDLERFLINL